MQIDITKDIKKLRQYSEELLYSEDSERAIKLIIYLRKEIKKLDLERSNNLLFRDYQKMILKLKWISLGYLLEEEILELIKNNFVDIYNINDDYDIWRFIKIKLLQELDLDKRNSFKLKIRNVLSDNSQILVKSGDLKRVGDWVKRYIKEVGGAMVSKLKQISFFQSNSNIQKLDNEDKIKVKKLLNFYEKLKISSKSLRGVEEEIIVPIEESPTTYIKEGEILAPIKNEKLSVLSKIIDKRDAQKVSSLLGVDYAKIKQLDQMAGQYKEGSLERKAIEEEIGKLKAKS